MLTDLTLESKCDKIICWLAVFVYVRGKNYHSESSCEIIIVIVSHFYQSSTSLPGGNQVDGLPPVSS